MMEAEAEKVLSCCNCNDEIDGPHLEYDGEIYCSGCIWTCEYCGEKFPDRCVAYVVAGGGCFACQECIDKHYISCACCGSLCASETYITVDGRVCRYCYVDNYFQCEGCGEIRHNNAYAGDGHYAVYCNDCYSDEKITNLHSHSYKPTPRFNGRGDLYFGIELECLAPDSVSGEDAVESLPTWAYAKADSSLSGYGMEIVTHPVSWDFLCGHKNELRSKVFDLKAAGFRSYDTACCGMHVHLSRSAFSGLRLYRFLKLFYESSSLVLLISRRNKSQLSQWASVDTSESIAYKIKNKTNGKSGRYTAVNLKNAETIEIRIFRGTLSETGFWRNLEFVRAAYDYSGVAPTRTISAGNFLKWIEARQFVYPNLGAFLRRKEQIQCV